MISFTLFPVFLIKCILIYIFDESVLKNVIFFFASFGFKTKKTDVSNLQNFNIFFDRLNPILY